MQIKVCGLREPENILAIARLPVDWLGFIFYAKSPRAVKPELAQWLEKQEEALAGKKRVGVFVNAEIEEVLNAVHDFQLDVVQLHGEESPEYCQLIRNLMESTSMRKAQLMKAFQVGGAFDFNRVYPYAAHCAYVLFDTKGKNYGGNGEQFNWELLQQYQGVTPFWLSGGIGPEDTAAVNAFSHPQWCGIDLNSKFETAPGLKDPVLLKSFVESVKNESL
ncbi:MAG: phosphoribosylanthranilate isomerase [Phaeodactylibacter sp.]|uniref:phosphoribosylanthranilate isomerase n=1 Tax=Phaeodactylibacter sp. TaxID=1940289 RepID=UPI0032EAFEFB